MIVRKTKKYIHLLISDSNVFFLVQCTLQDMWYKETKSIQKRNFTVNSYVAHSNGTHVGIVFFPSF
uniref:Uncharacterized protein n=1 Tax=Daphnia magna TaxID=35525 RepID=A0A0P6B3L9_9CRUS